MSLREEIKPYIDSYGLIADQPGGSSGNGLLNLSLYYCILVKRGEARMQDLADFERVVRSCQVEPGNLKRSPGNGDLEAGDDYKGVCAAAYLLKSVIAREILDYGKAHNFVYNWKEPGRLDEGGRFTWRPFLGREPGLVAHIHFSAGEKPSVPLELAWAGTLLWSGRSNPNDQDAWKLSWCLVQSMDGKSAICSVAARNWQSRLVKAHPGGMREVLTAYWGHEHPIARYFP